MANKAGANGGINHPTPAHPTGILQDADMVAFKHQRSGHKRRPSQHGYPALHLINAGISDLFHHNHTSRADKRRANDHQQAEPFVDNRRVEADNHHPAKGHCDARPASPADLLAQENNRHHRAYRHGKLHRHRHDRDIIGQPQPAIKQGEMHRPHRNGDENNLRHFAGYDF